MSAPGSGFWLLMLGAKHAVLIFMLIRGCRMTAASQLQFYYVSEQDSALGALFPHRFDYIYAQPPQPGNKPEWRTESRHPLSDRLLQQGSYLYGVRFGSQTQYCMLDIDHGSLYHPRHDPLAIGRIVAALEAIGLVAYVACTSSYSGGLHLYFPFQQAQSSWELASVVGTLLGNAGFTLQPGQLEIFPNPKPYLVEGAPSLFNAHRLPMQIGSYVLDRDFQPIWSDPSHFVQQWQLAAQRNAIETTDVKRILKQAKRKHHCISGKADKFINDLNAEIELGWTGTGQTNRLLGRITMRAYIFNHVIVGGTPLSGKKLVETIVGTAESLPGYREWCQHQHEIVHRAEEWVRCIENSHYFHYGTPKGKYKDKLQESGAELDPAIKGLPSWNQQQQEAARERIRSAVVDLLEKDSLPVAATARFRALLQYGIGGGSLYRHRDLWHPHYLVESPSNSPNAFEDSELHCENTSNSLFPSSLFPTADGDKLSCVSSSDRSTSDSHSTGSNLSPCPSINSATVFSVPFVGVSSVSPELLAVDSPCWLAINQEAFAEARRRSQQIRAEAQQQRYIQRMQQYLQSGDPILIAEAIAWARVNPGVLQTDRLDDS